MVTSTLGLVCFTGTMTIKSRWFLYFVLKNSNAPNLDISFSMLCPLFLILEKNKKPRDMKQMWLKAKKSSIMAFVQKKKKKKKIKCKGLQKVFLLDQAII